VLIPFRARQANADDRKSGDPPQLELDLVFPAHVGGAAAPRAFGALRTQFAMLHTYFGALDALRFDDVYLESANGVVRVEVRLNTSLGNADLRLLVV
jgi:hypothetical protein